MIRTSRSADRVKVTFALPLHEHLGTLQRRRRLQRVDPGQPRAAQAHERHAVGVGDRAARHPAAVPLPGRGRQLVQRPRRAAPRRRRRRGGRLTGGSEARRPGRRTGRATRSESLPHPVAWRAGRRGTVRPWTQTSTELAAAHGVATSYRGERTPARRGRRGRRGPRARAARRRRGRARGPHGGAGPRPGEGGARRAAGHDRAPRRRGPPAARAGRADRRRGHADRRHRAARRPRARLLPARAGRRGARPRGHRRRGTGRAAGDPAVVGLDAAALRAALAGLVGHRRPRRPARVRRVDRPRARRGGRAAQPAARHHARAAGAGVALHAVEQAVRDAAGAAGHRPRRSTGTPTTTPAPRWTRCGPTPSATGSTTTGCGRPSARPASCCGTRRGGPSPSARRTTCGSSRSSARSPSATGAGGASGRRGCATRAAPDVDRARVELAPRVAFHAWLQDQVQEPARRRARRRRRRSACGSCTTSPSAATPRAPTAGRCRTSSRWACTSVPRRTPSASRARTGGCRRGARTGSTPPATPPTATCCAPLLRQADGLRIDHVAGLWRLWWVPPGESPRRGTYVHYDSEVMLAVLTLEAWARGRAGDRRGPRDGGAGGDRGAGRSATSWARPCSGSPATIDAPG